jgi:hypothetical protein
MRHAGGMKRSIRDKCDVAGEFKSQAIETRTGQGSPSGLPSCEKVTGAQQQSFAMQAHHDALNLGALPAKSTSGTMWYSVA